MSDGRRIPAFFSENDLYRLPKIKKLKDYEFEYEARLGTFVSPPQRVIEEGEIPQPPTFKSGVPEKNFVRILAFLNLCNDVGKDKHETIDYSETRGNITYIKTVRINDGNISTYSIKRDKVSADFPLWNYRFSMALEQPLYDPPAGIVFSQDKFRRKERTTYYCGPKSIFHETKIDMTIVTNERGQKQFEVEMEKHKKLTPFDPEKFFDKFLRLYAINENIELLTPKNIEKITTEGIMEYLILPENKKKIIKSFNLSLRHENKKSNVVIQDEFIDVYRNEPRNIKLTNFEDSESGVLGLNKLDTDENPEFAKMRTNYISKYAVTCKLDGKRKLLFIFNGNVYMINPPFEISLLGSVSYVGTAIIDCEFIEKEFFCFDMLYDNVSIQEKDLLSRLISLRKIVQELEKDKESSPLRKYSFIVKKFYYSAVIDIDEVKSEVFYSNAKKALEDCSSYRHKNDGLIIQPVFRPYKNDYTYKWKPSEDLTIDLLVKVDNIGGEKVNLYTTNDERNDKNNSRYCKFMGTQNEPYVGKPVEIFENEMFKGEKVDNRIIEFSWNFKLKNFTPIRFRDDRPIPNKKSVALSVWSDIQRPISKSTIIGEDLIMMRRLHNLVKTQLLDKYARGNNINLLDIGSGRGGDLNKWEKLNLKVLCVEPEEANIKIMTERMKNMNNNFINNIQIIHCGAEETAKILQASGGNKFDCGAAFFSLTFFGKSEEMMDQLITTIKETLSDDGIFMGVVMDGDRVKKLLKDDGRYEAVDKSFSIRYSEPKDKTNVDKFGVKIITTINDENSMVKDAEEYLFNFSEFKDRMEKIGMQALPECGMFIDQKSSKRVATLSESSIIFSRLMRMFVFKKGKNAIDIRKKKTMSENGLFIERKKVIRDNSSLFHSFFHCISKNYRENSDSEKKEYVKSMRAKLAVRLSKNEFNKLSKGDFSRALTQNLKDGKKISQEEANELAYRKFQNLLGSYDEIASDNLEIIEYISHFFGANIYIMNIEGKFLVPKSEVALTYKERVELLYKKRTTSVILLNIDDVYFEPMMNVKNSKFTFSPAEVANIYPKEIFNRFPKSIIEEAAKEGINVNYGEYVVDEESAATSITPKEFSQAYNIIKNSETLFRYIDPDVSDLHIINFSGNIGCETLLLKKIYPLATITSVEPDPKKFALLRQNVDNVGYILGHNFVDKNMPLINNEMINVISAYKYESEKNSFADFAFLDPMGGEKIKFRKNAHVFGFGEETLGRMIGHLMRYVTSVVIVKLPHNFDDASLEEIKSDIYSADVQTEEHYVYENSDGDVSFKLVFVIKRNNKQY